MEKTEWPACQKCSQGTLIPLSDYGREGAPITYKAWVCTNPDCGFNLRIDNGEISLRPGDRPELQVGSAAAPASGRSPLAGCRLIPMLPVLTPDQSAAWDARPSRAASSSPP